MANFILVGDVAINADLVIRITVQKPTRDEEVWRVLFDTEEDRTFTKHWTEEDAIAAVRGFVEKSKSTSEGVFSAKQWKEACYANANKLAEQGKEVEKLRTVLYYFVDASTDCEYWGQLKFTTGVDYFKLGKDLTKESLRDLL